MHKLMIAIRNFNAAGKIDENESVTIGDDVAAMMDDFYFQMATEIKRMWAKNGEVIIQPEQANFMIGRFVLISTLVNNRCTLTVIEDSKFVEGIEYVLTWSDK